MSSPCYVYFITSKMRKGTAVKIGKAKDITERLNTLQTGSPEKLTLYGYVECRSEQEAYELEKQLHEQFANARLTGEWFRLSGNIRTFINAVMDGDRRKAARAMDKNNKQREKGHYGWNKVVTVKTVKLQ